MTIAIFSADSEIRMDGIPAAEERAEVLVGVERDGPSGGFYLVLRVPAGRAVFLGPYDNRDVAKLEATRVRGFVAAVNPEARDTCSGLNSRTIGDVGTRNESSAEIPASELRRQFRTNG